MMCDFWKLYIVLFTQISLPDASASANVIRMHVGLSIFVSKVFELGKRCSIWDETASRFFTGYHKGQIPQTNLGFIRQILCQSEDGELAARYWAAELRSPSFSERIAACAARFPPNIIDIHTGKTGGLINYKLP